MHGRAIGRHRRHIEDMLVDAGEVVGVAEAGIAGGLEIQGSRGGGGSGFSKSNPPPFAKDMSQQIGSSTSREQQLRRFEMLGDLCRTDADVQPCHPASALPTITT
jgi:hypothetical protein